MHPSKVLVSGANGFIGVWVVHTLLEKGYNVYGTVRSKEKCDHLKKLFEAHADRLHFFIVEDIAKVRFQPTSLRHFPS
jgi:nucleoside-diphosphate-sugar epimerase